METLKHGEKNICPKCGFEANNDAAFCPQCGTALKNKKNELPVQRVGEQENNNVTSTQDAVVVPPEVLASEEKSVPKVEDNPSSDNINDEDSIETPWEKLLKDISLNCQCFSALENNSEAEEAYQEALDYYNGRNGLEIDHFMTIYTLNQAVKLGKKEALLQLDVILRDLLHTNLGFQCAPKKIYKVLETLKETDVLLQNDLNKKLELSFQSGNDKAWKQLLEYDKQKWYEEYKEKEEKFPEDIEQTYQKIVNGIKQIITLGIDKNIEEALVVAINLYCGKKFELTNGEDGDCEVPVGITFPVDLEKAEKLVDKFNLDKSYNQFYAVAIRNIAQAYENEDNYKECTRLWEKAAIYGDSVAAYSLINLYKEDACHLKNYWAMIAKENLRREKNLKDALQIPMINEMIEKGISEVLEKNKPILTINHYKLTFSDELKKYIQVDQRFRVLMKVSLNLFNEEYEKYKDMWDVDKYCKNQGLSSLKWVAKEAIALCAKNGVYSINEEQILQYTDCGMNAIGVWNTYVDPITHRWKELKAKEDIFPSYEHENNLENGIALKGNIKKNIEARAKEAIYEYYPNNDEIYTDLKNDLKQIFTIESLFKDKRTKNTFIYGLACAIENIRQEVLIILDASNVLSNVDKAQIIFENIKKGIVPEKDVLEAIITAFLKDPFCVNIYKVYLEKFGDEDRKIEAFANYFGIKDKVDKIKRKLIVENKQLLDFESGINSLRSKNETDEIKREHMQDFLTKNGPLIETNGIIRNMLVESHTKESLEKNFSLLNEYFQNFKQYIYYIQYTDNGPIHTLYKLIVSKKMFLNPKKQIVITDGTEVIQPFQYMRCVASNVSIPSSVKKIGEYAFVNGHIAKIKFSRNSNLSEIKEGAFCNCTYQKNDSKIVFPNSLKNIGDFAFRNFDAVFYVPTSVTEIGMGAFSNIKLGHIQCEADSEAAYYAKHNQLRCNIWDSVQNIIVSKELRLPEYVTEIVDLWCAEVSSNTLIIPGNIKRIHDLAMNLPDNLENVIFNNGIEELGEQIFVYSKNIKTVYLPASLQKIGEDCFNENITLICKKGTFAYEYCVKNHLNFKLDNGDGPEHTTVHMAPAPKVMVNKKSFDKVSGAKAIENNNNASNKPSEKEEEVSTKQGCLTLIIIIVIIGAIIKWIF